MHPQRTLEAGFLDFLKTQPPRPRAGENALSLALSPKLLENFIKKTRLNFYTLTDLDTWAVPNGVQAEFSLASGHADLTGHVTSTLSTLKNALEDYAGVPVKMDVEPTIANADNIYERYTEKYTVTFKAKTPAGALHASAQRVASRYLLAAEDAPPEKLSDDPWRYFKKVPGTIMVDLKDLTPIRARPKGIENARKYMWMAYNGEMDKRKPISLKDNGDGTYTVLDGNSTFANASASKWKQIPGVVEEGDGH
jgi:hypothetical protein